VTRNGATGEFDVVALHRALDAKRSALGLSWAQTAREVSRPFEKSGVGTISPGTLSGLPRRGSVEGDGVLQMLLWLDRTPESFVAGHPRAADPAATLPRLDPRHILRFDAPAIHAALDAQRIERKMTWAQVAGEIGGCTAASLTGMAGNERVSFPRVMKILAWLGRPVASFTRASSR
jgi:hypothetical protein